MRRLNLTCVLVAMVLTLMVAAGPSLGINGAVTGPFPALHYGLQNGVGNGAWSLRFYQGWFEGQQAWYILENGSNDIMTNHWVSYKTLFPKLGSAIGNAAMPVYVVLNFQQGPVFSAMPGEADYSALWQIYYITWKPGIPRRPIISDLDLPNASEADIVATDIVVDRPIIATGPLGGPWYPAPPGRYRIKQALAVDVRNRLILLPFWLAYGQDRISRSTATAWILMPDVADPALAALIGANYAPGLADMDPANTQKLWVQDWTMAPYPPPAQFAVLEHLPDYSGHNTFSLNDNYDFSNIMDLTGFVRTGLPPYVVIKTASFLQSQIGTGITLQVPPIRVNAVVIGYFFQRPFPL